MDHNSPTKYSLSSVFSALLGSWGGIAALAYALLGGGASLAASLVAFREWLGPFRGLFFLVALILVGRSHYLYWGGHGRARWLTRATLWVSTALALIMVGVFYVYGNPLFFGKIVGIIDIQQKQRGMLTVLEPAWLVSLRHLSRLSAVFCP